MDGAAVAQLEKTAALPGMWLAVGLPDLHPGKGSPIGAAFVADGWIYPSLVGNDIGCGIGLWRTALPAGKPKRDVWADRLRNLDGPWDGDSREWLRDRRVVEARFDESVGTIGSGNHFAELQMGEDAVYLCVHSGSRGFGEAVLREFGQDGVRADSLDGAAYMQRHDDAMRWGAANRELIAARILECLGTTGERVVDVCHNWVERREFEGSVCWVHRKGAAPSTCGPVVIPGSRGALTYWVNPVEPRAASGWSLAHGAGRKSSRSDSRAKLEKRFTAKLLERTELGSQVICEDKALLYEEAPQAYKNITTVIEDLVKAGPAECEWAAAGVAEALLREAGALLREAGAQGVGVRVLERTEGSWLLEVTGDEGRFVAGWTGTVQWMGRSPFWPAHKRKNWFVGVTVLEPVEETRFDPRDVRWETMRASGPGGQHVNRTESAVRVTHLPTGARAMAMEERSQLRNRKLALARLAGRIAEMEAGRHGAVREARWRAHHALERGNPVRVIGAAP